MHNREANIQLIKDASDKPDLSKEEEVAFYHKYAIRCKSDLLEAVKNARNELFNRKESEDCLPKPHTFFVGLSHLFEQFYQDVDSMFLMEPLNDWWGYVISVQMTGISLKLCHLTMTYDNYVTPTEDWPTIGSFIEDETYVLHTTPAKLLTLDEFGKSYGVAADTVRQWIRRGKLSNAVKFGNDWRIPEFSIIKKQSLYSNDYYWENEIPDPPEELPDINSYDNVVIYLNQQKKVWAAKLSCERQNGIDEKEIELDIKQKEKLELYLIAHPMIFFRRNYLGEYFSKYYKP